MTTTTEAMPRPQTFKNWLRRFFVVALLLLLGIGGLKLYLGSAHARRFAAERFSAQIGLPVQIDNLQIGASSIEASIRILDDAKSSEGTAKELFRVGSLTADISLVNLMTGSALPREVVLRDVTVSLPFDQDGNLAFKLPETSESTGPTAWPRVRIENGQINLERAGQAGFQLKQIQASAEYRDGQYKITGTVADKTWGDWSIDGSFATEAKTGWVELATADAPVDSELIRAIPPIPNETWAHIRTSGRSAASVRFEIRENSDLNYSVVLKPAGQANLTLLDIDTPFQNLRGKIVINGKKITIEDAQSSLADGTVNARGVLDFEPVRSKMDFTVRAKGLDISKLPASWSLPQQFTGKLRGEAKLELVVTEDGQIQPLGGGSATIDDAKVAGLPAEVRLRLRGDGKRYRFESEPKSKPTPKEESKPRAPNPGGKGDKLSDFKVMLIQPAPKPAPLQPKPATPETQEQTTLETSITLRDVDVSKLLQQLQVEVPYRFEGKVTLQVEAAVPIGGVADRKSYRFHGSMTSKLFRFEGLEVHDLRADLLYQNGELTLRELSATLPTAEGPAGRVKGVAKAAIEPRGDLTASLELTDIPMNEIRRAIPGLAFELIGRVTAKAEFRSPINDLRQPVAWKASATLSAKSLVFEKASIGEFEARGEIERGIAKLSIVNAEVFRGTITGSAELPLVAATSGQVAVQFKEIDSAIAIKLMEGFPIPITGRITGKVTAKAVQPKDAGALQIDASLELSAPKLTVQGVPAERLTGSVSFVEGVAEYRLEGHSLGGTFQIKGQYPGKQPRSERGQLQIQNVDLNRIARFLNIGPLEQIQGRVNLTFDYDPDGSAGAGRVSVEDIRLGRFAISSGINGSIQLREGVIDLRDFNGRVAEGQLRIRGRHDLKDSRRNYFVINLDRASARQLAPLIPGLDSLHGQVTVQARGKIGFQSSTGSLVVSLSAGRLGDISITDLRVPIEWSGGLSGGHIVIREAIARSGTGKVTANLTYQYGYSGRLTGSVLFDRMPLYPLIGSAANTLGSGKVSGRFDMSGNAVRSIDDITGTLNASLSQTTVREIPLMSVITPFLAPIGFLQPFEDGEVKGRLAGGIFRIERFVLSNPGAKVYADGSVTTRGRIDLDVIAMTGQVGANTRALRLFGVNIPAFGPLPITLITRISEELSNRTIRLSVSGTLSSPKVQINRTALLKDAAIRFLLGQYVLPDAARNFP